MKKIFDTIDQNPDLERLLSDYPVTKESLQLEKSLSNNGKTKSICYTKWLFELKKHSVKKDMIGESMSTPEEPPCLVSGFGFMKGSLYGSFEINNEGTWKPEIPQDLITQILDKCFIEMTKRGGLKHYSKL